MDEINAKIDSVIFSFLVAKYFILLALSASLELSIMDEFSLLPIRLQEIYAGIKGNSADLVGSNVESFCVHS